MKKFNFILTVGLVCLLLGTALAEVVPTQMNFQGVLTNSTGNPIADSTKSVQFTIYDAATNGSVLWAETLNVTTDNQGRFTVILGQIYPLYGAIFSDTSRYLGVTVGNDPEISPRAKISTVAYSLRTRTINGAFGGTLVGGSQGEGAVLFMDNGFGENGASLWGNAAGQGGSLYLSDETGNLTFVAEPDISGSGGALYLFEDNTTLTHILSSSFSGTGAYMRLYSDAAFSSNGVSIDCNPAGSGQPSATIVGTSDVVQFALNLPGGNGKVTLPNDAISNEEMFNEPGVSSYVAGGPITLSGGTEVIASRTINPPSSGYVLVIGTCRLGVSHVNGILSFAVVSVSTAPGSIPSDLEHITFISANAPTATYAWPVTSHSLFPVGPGPTTLYFLAAEGTGSWDVAEIQFTVVYFPTAYGTVDVPSAIQSSMEKENSSLSALTPAEIKAEQVKSIADNQTRIENELALMKAQVEELKKKLEQEANFKRVQAPQK